MGTVRFLLALWVAVSHAHGSALFGIQLFDGGTAVQCFYVISGFLITMVLNERAEYRSVGKFYVSRYLRLWPPYILIALLTWWLAKPWLVSILPPDTGIMAKAAIIVANLTLFAQDWILFLKFDGGGLGFTEHFGLLKPPQPYSFIIVPQAWSLGIELTFYLIAPFVCRKWWSVMLLFLFGLGTRLVLGWLGLFYGPWLMRFAPAEMMLFAAGGLSYFVGRLVYGHYPRAIHVAGLAGIAGFVALTAAADWITPRLSVCCGAINTTLVLIYWPVLLFTALSAAPMFYATRRNRLDQLLGELSYPIYLCHILVGHMLDVWKSRLWPDEGNLTYLALVIAVSLALVYGVIGPLELLRKRFGARSFVRQDARLATERA